MTTTQGGTQTHDLANGLPCFNHLSYQVTQQLSGRIEQPGIQPKWIPSWHVQWEGCGELSAALLIMPSWQQVRWKYWLACQMQWTSNLSLSCTTHRNNEYFVWNCKSSSFTSQSCLWTCELALYIYWEFISWSHQYENEFQLTQHSLYTQL